MKNTTEKLLKLIFMLAFSAGVIFLSCAFFTKIPHGVTVNGIDVGGKSRTQAAETIRKSIAESLKDKSLIVCGRVNKYRFTYPEIAFKDNLQTLLKTVKKGGSYNAEVGYYLNGLNEIADNICLNESIQMINPYSVFNTEGDAFTYFEGIDGLKADGIKLKNDIRASLKGGFNAVNVSFKTVKRETSLAEVRYNTRLLSTFTTRFDGSNTDRTHNIRLAAQLINGTVLENGESFSFNQTVGQRTAERGFRPAKIIERGEFVEGIGGGVCQVSTTLFNAALLAGCDMTEFHSHSLAVSYVPPSFDAMVSGTYFDLKFQNLTGFTLYIRAVTNKNSITFDVYGRGDGAKYEYSSVVTGTIQAPEEITTDSALVKAGKDGTISEGYLTVTRNGVRQTRFYRRDKYAPVKRVVLEPVEEGETLLENVLENP